MHFATIYSFNSPQFSFSIHNFSHKHRKSIKTAAVPLVFSVFLMYNDMDRKFTEVLHT